MVSDRSSLVVRSLSVLATAVLLAPAGDAQLCVGPDGLNGPCWQPVGANIPPLDDINDPGSAICWVNCAPQPKVCINVVATTPVPTICGQYMAPIEILDCAGLTLLKGDAILDYTRTWEETDLAGRTYQVYRFLAKVDLGLSGGFLPPCVAPTCLSVHPTAFYYGYIDYAFECTSATFRNAVVLHHACDNFIHHPVFSDKPGVFHPGTSYSIVAPDTSLNPFLPVLLPHTGGPLIAEAVRNVVDPTGLGLCVTEEPITQGNLMPFLQGCACPGSPVPQNSANFFSGMGSCPDPAGVPSSFTAIDLSSAGAPWRRLVATSIGTWTTPATYPGMEEVLVDEGLLSYHDSCAAVPGAIGDFREIHYGATTRGGYAITPNPLFPTTQNLIDTASNLSIPLGAPTIPPFFGSVRKTDHLIYAYF